MFHPCPFVGWFVSRLTKKKAQNRPHQFWSIRIKGQIQNNFPPFTSGSSGFKYVSFDIILGWIELKGKVGPWQRYQFNCVPFQFLYYSCTHFFPSIVAQTDFSFGKCLTLKNKLCLILTLCFFSLVDYSFRPSLNLKGNSGKFYTLT